ncbi:hypothetical protein Q2941_18530 [Bradyrhizobium sp. UFLA05-153]
MTNFVIVPPRRPPKPVKVCTLVNRLIWKANCIAFDATAIDHGLPPVYVDYVLGGLVSALRDAADRIEQHQRQLKEQQGK